MDELGLVAIVGAAGVAYVAYSGIQSDLQAGASVVNSIVNPLQSAWNQAQFDLGQMRGIFNPSLYGPAF